MADYQDAQERKTLLLRELDRIVKALKDDYGAQKIILFGSLADGQIHEWSDIDLTVVRETDKKGPDRFIEVVDLCRWKVATHVIVYTPEEFERLEADPTSFLNTEVLSKGKVLYAA